MEGKKKHLRAFDSKYKRSKREEATDAVKSIRGMRYVIPEEDRTNDTFLEYYMGQGVISASDLAEFHEKIALPLATTFRLNETLSHVNVLEQYLQNNYSKYAKKRFESDYPIWQIEFDDYNEQRDLKKFCEEMNRCGRLRFQEIVSMIPALLLQLRAEDKVLDMCSAPGSKTCQAILSQNAIAIDMGKEFLNTVLVANDKDSGRACLPLQRNVALMNSPAVVITLHDASKFPESTQKPLDNVYLFDKIICDVPCSGDGTLRKNQSIWNRWSAKDGMELHFIQFKIFLKALRLLSPGGRIVYSTCSLNPIENEAVIAAGIRWYYEDLFTEYSKDPTKQFHHLNIVQDTSPLPSGLQFSPGLSSWRVPLLPSSSSPSSPISSSTNPSTPSPDPSPAASTLPFLFTAPSHSVPSLQEECLHEEQKKISSIYGPEKSHLLPQTPIILHPRASKALIKLALKDNIRYRCTVFPPMEDESFTSTEDAFLPSDEAEAIDKAIHDSEGLFDGDDGEGWTGNPLAVRRADAALLRRIPQVMRQVESRLKEQLPLSMRFLPHQNDTGGFFVCVVEKSADPLTLTEEEKEELFTYQGINRHHKSINHARFERNRAKQIALKEELAVKAAEEEEKERVRREEEEEEKIENEEKEEEGDERPEGEERGEWKGRKKRVKPERNEIENNGNTKEQEVLMNTFLVRSHESQRRKSAFASWRFDLFPPVMPRKGDTFDYVETTSTAYRNDSGDSILYHPLVVQLSQWFNISFHSKHISPLSSNTPLLSQSLEVLFLGELALLCQISCKGDLLRIVGVTEASLQYLLTSPDALEGHPVPAIIQVGIKLFEFMINDFLNCCSMRFRPSLQGASYLAKNSSSDRKIFLNETLSLTLLQQKLLPKAALLDMEDASEEGVGQVKGYKSLVERQLEGIGPCLVFLSEEKCVEKGGEGVWAPGMVVGTGLSLYMDHDMIKGLLCVFGKKK